MGHGHKTDAADDNDYQVNMQSLHNSKNQHLADKNSFDLTKESFWKDPNNEHMQYNAIIYDQGQTGSCTANAVASAYNYVLQRQGRAKGDEKQDFMPSRLFLYYVGRISDEDIEGDLIQGDPDNKRKRSGERGQAYADLRITPPTKLLLEDEGSYIREVLRILSRLGAPTESKKYKDWDRSEWPFVDVGKWEDIADPEIKKYATAPKEKVVGSGKDFYEPFALPAQAPYPEAFEAAQKHTAFHYARPEQTVHCWKHCIANGYPVIFGLEEHDDSKDKDKDFTYYVKNDPHVVMTPTAKNQMKNSGGHTVLAVGWDDEKAWIGDDAGKGCFRIQNSWNRDTGDQGFFWLPYSWLTLKWPLDANNNLVDSPWIICDSEDNTDLVTKPATKNP